MRRQTGHESLHVMAGKNRSPAQKLSKAAQSLSRFHHVTSAQRTKRLNHCAALGHFPASHGAIFEPYLHLSHGLSLQRARRGMTGQPEVTP